MTVFSSSIKYVFHSRRAFYFALILCAFSSFTTFWYGHLTGFSDEGHYWNLANGLHEGRFSAWYFLPVSTPDTLRMWGYPFFIYLCQFISHTFLSVQVFQFILYGISVAMMLKLIKHYNASLVYRTVFLLLLVVNNHIAFYAGVLIAECTFTFFTVLLAYIYEFKKKSAQKYVLLALVSYILFQLKPIFLLFPFFFIMYALLVKRGEWKFFVLYGIVFGVLLIPFGYWNKVNHGVFKITPLEGGYGVMYQGGYWDYRLPIGFKAPYYWGIDVDDDLVQPSFISEEEKKESAKEFVNEWEIMLKDLRANHFTKEDSLREKLYTDTAYANARNFLTYSSDYTLAREQMIKKNLVKQIKRHTSYYIETRIYTFFRQWFTGINGVQLRKASTVAGYIRTLYPFFVTFTFIFGGLIISCIQVVRGKISWQRYDIYLLLIFYIAFADLPFGVMSRYTVPVHFFILMFLSMILVNYFNHTSRGKLKNGLH